MLGVLIAILPVLIVAGIGFGWVKSGRSLEDGTIRILTTYFGSPALAFYVLTSKGLTLSTYGQTAGAVLTSLLLVGLVGAFALFVLGEKVRPLLPTILLPSCGAFGLSVALFALGEQGLTFALVYSSLVMVVQFTVGEFLAAGHFSIQQVLRSPTIHAVIISIVFMAMGITPPKWIQDTAQMLGGITIPLLLLSMGGALARLSVAELGLPMRLSLLRVGLGTASGWLAAIIWQLPPIPAAAVIIQASMPPAIFNYLFASKYAQRDVVAAVAGAVLVGTVVSMTALPGILYVLK